MSGDGFTSFVTCSCLALVLASSTTDVYCILQGCKLSSPSENAGVASVKWTRLCSTVKDNSVELVQAVLAPSRQILCARATHYIFVHMPRVAVDLHFVEVCNHPASPNLRKQTMHLFSFCAHYANIVAVGFIPTAFI
jgi:hypothetical protein